MCKSPRTQIHLCAHVNFDVVVVLTYVGNAVQQCRTMYENTTIMCDVALHCYINVHQLSWMCIIVWHCCNHVHSHLTMLQHCYATVLQHCCIVVKLCTTITNNMRSYVIMLQKCSANVQYCYTDVQWCHNTVTMTWPCFNNVW